MELSRNGTAIGSSSNLDSLFAQELQIARPITAGSVFEPLPNSIAIDICSAFNLQFESLPDFGPVCLLSADPDQQQQLRCYDVPGDGHCMFSSFSYLMSGHINNNIKLREIVRNHMLQYSNAISVTFLRGFSSVESYIAGSRMNDQGYATDLEISLFCNLFLCNVFVSSKIGWMKFAPTNSSGFYNLYVRIRGEHFDPILEVFPV